MVKGMEDENTELRRSSRKLPRGGGSRKSPDIWWLILPWLGLTSFLGKTAAFSAVYRRRTKKRAAGLPAGCSSTAGVPKWAWAGLGLAIHAAMASNTFRGLPILLVFSLFWPLAVAIDFSYPAVFNFGDSNSDTGGLVAGIGERLDPPNGKEYFRKPSGRFCDGRLIIDFLLAAMDLPFLNAYLDSVGIPNFHKGCNFAAAGSTVLPATASSVSPFSFGIQVAQFLRFKARVLELLGKKIDKFLPQEEYFKQGLYMFDIGQNDLAGAFYSKTEDQKLYEQGAREFWIHNTGPLGCLPQNVATFGKDTLKLDDLGCVSSHNRVAKLFNLQLHALCKKLQGGFIDSNITYVDIFTIKFNLLANYSRYGFDHPTTACCGYGGPPLNFDNRVRCGQTKTINGSSVTTTVCDDPTEFISWDGIHYTEAANLYVSSQILTGKYSDPPFSDQMPFLMRLKF
ncbi:hypothetical protein ACLOJK_025910 [Asimina triloba]